MSSGLVLSFCKPIHKPVDHIALSEQPSHTAGDGKEHKNRSTASLKPSALSGSAPLIAYFKLQRAEAVLLRPYCGTR